MTPDFQIWVETCSWWQEANLRAFSTHKATEIPHLNITNRSLSRLAQVVPVRLECSSVTDWVWLMASVTGIIYVKCSTVSGGVTHCLRASVQWSGRAEIKLMTDWSQTADRHFVSFSAGSRPFGKHPNSNFQTVLGLKMTTLLIYCPRLSMIEYMSAIVSHGLLYMTPLKKVKKS